MRKESTSMDASNSSCCGICLSDNENSIRGQIDSCEHHFCFICIMEWAKVESRCPLCKRRFTTIRRPPKDGVFPSERLVNVPERDQVYHLFGNASVRVGPFDPYAQVQCGLCHSSKDESLLLLCDLCDSAAHAYCVGLGAIVPEGDWFCHDCAVSRNEHDKLQKDDDGDDMGKNTYSKSKVTLAAESSVPSLDIDCANTSGNSNAMEVHEADVSIFDIVGQSDIPLIHSERLLQLGSDSTNLAGEMAQPGERTRRKRLEGRTTEANADGLTPNNARTLSRCRNVHSYIRVLRENWSSLQSGSLRFSSSSSESSSQPISSSTSGQQPTTNGGTCETQDRHDHDIEKAWKLMSKAKSIQQGHRRTINVDPVSKNKLCKGKRTLIDRCSSLNLSRTEQLSFDSRKQLGKQRRLCSEEKHAKKHTSSRLELQKHSAVAPKGIVKSEDNLLTTSPGLSVSVSCGKVQTSSRCNVFYENWETSVQKNQHRASANLADKQDGTDPKATLVGSVPGNSKSLNTGTDFNASSSTIDVTAEDVRKERSCTKSTVKKDNDAKSEILSLVKLNLKLLNGGKQLGTNTFKEVARLATHTILAACGLEHSRHVLGSSPRFSCSHSESIKQLRKSSIMPNSCRECFYVFVKDVVDSILSDKVSHSKS